VQKFQGAKVPGPIRSGERKFQGANWPESYWPIRSRERIGLGAKRLWIVCSHMWAYTTTFCLGVRYSSPSGFGRSPTAKRILMQFIAQNLQANLLKFYPPAPKVLATFLWLFSECRFCLCFNLLQWVRTLACAVIASEWVSSFLMAHQNIRCYSVPYSWRQIFRIDTVCYAEGLWRMRRHGPVIVHCTDSEDFPSWMIHSQSHTRVTYIQGNKFDIIPYTTHYSLRHSFIHSFIHIRLMSHDRTHSIQWIGLC